MTRINYINIWFERFLWAGYDVRSRDQFSEKWEAANTAHEMMPRLKSTHFPRKEAQLLLCYKGDRRYYQQDVHAVLGTES